MTAAGPRTFTLTSGERRERFRATLPLVANDVFFIREVIAAGGAVGPLPRYIARSEVEAGRLVPVLPAFGSSGVMVYFAHPPLNPLPRQIRLLREFLAPIVTRLFA